MGQLPITIMMRHSRNLQNMFKFVLIVLIALISGSAMSDEFTKSKIALSEGRKDDAIEALSNLVIAENAEAIYQTAMIYLGQQKVQRMSIWVLANDQGPTLGHDFAEVRMGWILIQWMDKVDEGLRLLTNAADRGNTLAQSDLGNLYLRGEYVETNIQAALKYLELAANSSNVEALISLADVFSNGTSLPIDYQKSLRYNLLALKHGSSKAKFNLAIMYSKGQGVEIDQIKALDYLQAAANDGISQAQVNLAAGHANGTFGAIDYAKAVTWYFEAAKQNDALAQNNLGLMYYYGQGIEKNLELALMWFILGRHNGSSEALKTPSSLQINWMIRLFVLQMQKLDNVLRQTLLVALVRTTQPTTVYMQAASRAI